MKKLTRNIKILISFLLVVALVFGAGLVYQMQLSQTELLAVAGENKQSLRQLYSQAGTIYSADGVKLASSETGDRTYAEDPNVQLAVSHYVGDYTHNMSNTLETMYQNELLGRKRNVVEQLVLDISGKGLQGDDLHLSVNATLSAYANQLLREGNYRGSVVLLNYKTGEVVAMTSTPATMMENIINYTDLPDTSLFNRSLNGSYEPGSTWKIMTGTSWLSSAKYNPDYVIESDGSALLEHGASDAEFKGMYGSYNLDRAFTTSSNVYFGQLAVLMGEEEYSNFIANTGFTKIDSLDRLSVSPLSFNFEAAKNDQALLSWAGTGQPVGELELNLSPLVIASITGAVANDGKIVQPRIIDYIENPLGRQNFQNKTQELGRAFDVAVANRMKEMMINAIQSEESIQYPAGISGFVLGGKSGTVQRESDEEVGQNALWTGFLDDENYPYAVAVVAESAADTSSSAIYIGNQVLAKAIELGSAGVE